MKTPYIIYHPLEDVLAAATHGQSWKGDMVKQGIDLCPYRLIEPFFRTYLPKNGAILEAGCGLGNWLFYLRDLGYDVVGIELAADAIQIAKEYDPGAAIFAADVLRTNFSDRHFDAVISLGVLEHFEEGPQVAFQEIRRILKDNGLLFVTVPIQNMNRRCIANPLKDFKRWLKRLSGIRYAFEEYRYTIAEFSSLLREANFEIVECVPDEYEPPKNIGLFVDYPFLRHKQNKWELNWIGHSLFAMIKHFSPWFASGGALWICRKQG